jgi:site-specific recombinase XerD
MIKLTDNVKHKAILMIIYSAGLRISEAINLQIEDVDSERKLIHIKGAKEKKIAQVCYLSKL